jgi:hypothetical protein
MCPVCLTTAVLIAGSVTSSGGLTAIAIKTFGGKNAVGNKSDSIEFSQDKKRKPNG